MNNLQPSDAAQKLYSYMNHTSKLQIIRIAHHPEPYFERVIFPGQRLLFEFSFNFELEIYTQSSEPAILLKKIPSFCLEVKQF